MLTKNELLNIMQMLNNEYDIIPTDENKSKLKMQTWYAMLKEYSYEDLQKAVFILFQKEIYGKPTINDLMQILKPKQENQNKGAEFAQRLVDLASRYGTDNIEQRVSDEFGKVGVSIYHQVKRELRVLLIDDEPTFKAQTRNLYNSYEERYELDNTIALPHINNTIKKLN